jgi:tRNA G46 methylase TrmB
MYTLSDGHEQVIFGNSPPMPRTTKLVMKLQQVVDLPTRGNLLDIGCGNGAFLKSFGKVYRSWSLAGFERDDSFRDDIMKIEGVAQSSRVP